MDSFETTKLAGAFLGTVFVLMSLSILSEAIFSHEAPEKPGYVIASAEGEGAAAEGGGEAAAAESILPLLASADAAAGETIFKKCAACHTVENGGANKVGPNLWNIVNRPIASHEGFGYSGPIKDFSQGGSVVWDYDHLDHFLAAPKKYISGTAMGFAGLKAAQDRANVVAYLRNQADSPAELPAAGAAPAAEGAAAPAEGEAKPAEGAAKPADGAAEGAAPAAPAEGAAKPADGAAPAEGAAPADKPAEKPAEGG